MQFRFEPYADGSPGGMVYFTCPSCGDESYVHVVPEPSTKQYWKLKAAEPLTIHPSVRWFKHCHFNIVNGEVQMHADEPCLGSNNRG